MSLDKGGGETRDGVGCRLGCDHRSLLHSFHLRGEKQFSHQADIKAVNGREASFV